MINERKYEAKRSFFVSIMEDDFVAYLEVLTFICFSLLHSDGSVQEAFVTF